MSIRTTLPVTTSPSLEGDERRVVVGDELAVDLDHEVDRVLARELSGRLFRARVDLRHAAEL